VNGKFISDQSDNDIEHLVYDSRRIQQPLSSLFFALITEHNNGHRFVLDAYKKGVRNFIVSENVDTQGLPDANIILVSDTLLALQRLVAFHRSHFHFPVISITNLYIIILIFCW